MLLDGTKFNSSTSFHLIQSHYKAMQQGWQNDHSIHPLRPEFRALRIRRTPCFFFQAEDRIRATSVTGVQTCALPIYPADRGAWKKGDRPFGAIHNGRTYLFASAEQQQKFLASPNAFAPVLSGCDPVVYAERGQLEIGRASCRERVEVVADSGDRETEG